MKEAMGDKQRLLHIPKAISEIQQYTIGTNEILFMQNSMMRFACVKQIEIIGEAANYLTPAIKENHPEILWNQITGMRLFMNTLA